MDGHLGYVLYPEAQKQLSVFSDAQSEIRRLDYADVFGPFRYSDWSSFRKDILRGLGGLSEQEREFFIEELAAVHEKRLPWRVLRGSGIKEIPSKNEDVLMLGGFYASHILSSDDLAGFMRFGFLSFPKLAGTFGAYMKSVLSSDWKGYGKKGYSWKSEHSDGRVFVNQLTTNEHADFWIVQTEVTPLLTLDPLGQRVEYRPLTDEDEHCIISVRGAELDCSDGFIPRSSSANE